MVVRLFLAVPRGCLQFVIVVFPDHTHLLFFFVICTIMKGNFYAYLILAFLAMTGIVKQLLMSILFKRYSININTIFKHTQRSQIFYVQHQQKQFTRT